MNSNWRRILFLILPISLLTIFLGSRHGTQAAPADTCPDISPLACTEVKLLPDQLFTFDGSDGGLADSNGVSTGFTMVDPPSSPGNPVLEAGAPGYWPERLTVQAGTLVISTTDGLAYGNSNSQDNALGIGLDMSQSVALETTLVDLPPATGGFVQAGLWFGKSSVGPSGLGGTGTAEDNYLKIVATSDFTGTWKVETLMEQEGVPGGAVRDPIDGTQPLTLRLELDPVVRSVNARYCSGSGCDAANGTLLFSYTDVPSEWFSADAAGIDFNVGTRSMGGILTSHRNYTSPLAFTFADFSYSADSFSTPFASPDGVDFSSWSFTMDNPPAEPNYFKKATAMAWGPDDRLYVLDVNGYIHIFTLDYAAESVVEEEVVDSVADRLALGLTVDPASTAENVILWVAHSDPDQSSGEANSGVVSKLSGPDLATVEDVITGLPRAIANHATNAIHFGPDGRLYIAQGGNTGAGAANDGESEFGSRPEQPLSAAILVADVKAGDFDGTCASEEDPTGAIMDATGVAKRDVPCDVAVYGSGLRNSYDFTFHTNGEMYATENGLGVVGTFPDLQPDDLTWDPATGCEGLVTDITNHNPGERPDLLQRIVEGSYYGHPNPSRDECVFFGGNPTAAPDFPVPGPSDDAADYFLETTKYDVGRTPEPEWEPAIFSFGLGKSANGIVEYNSNDGAFCGRLDGDLLVTYWSLSDQVRRLSLSEDGTTVVDDQTLIRTTTGTGGEYLSNPLPITQDPSGRIYVGEFGRRQISVFEPLNVGLWYTEGWSDLPVELLDAGSATIGQFVYAVGGKTAGGHQRALYAYDTVDNSWSTLAPLPTAYPAVENPAVVAHDGKLYVFGGSTAPFSGAVAKAAVYDPAQNTWTMLADMPTARGGATAQWFENEIYVVGGMNSSGESLKTVEKYDPATDSWTIAPDLQTPRDNPGSAVLNGALHIFGGRTRSGGVDVEPRLSSVERYTSAIGWTFALSMPTGRRSMNVVVVQNQAIVIGGERTPTGETYVATEAFNPDTGEWSLLANMPVGRHGAIAGAVDGVVYVAGGGTTAGSSYTADVDAFSFDCLVVEPDSNQLFLPLVTRD